MPTFSEALRYWLKLGFISFGGPAGQIAIMHQELVEKRRWISEGHFLHALNFCMLLPGPEATQLVTYLGWRLHGVKGGIAAGALFVLPSALILFALSWVFMFSGSLGWLAAVFHGLLPCVIAVVASAALRMGRKTLKSTTLWLMAAASFVAVFFFHVSFVWLVLGAGFFGWAGHRLAPRQFPAGHSHDTAGHEEADVLALPPCLPQSKARMARVTLLCLTLWWLPVLAVALWLGWGSTQAQQGLFFSKAALVTFGGAYAVLPYVAQEAVERHGWLTHGQMMSGLALAETTPGPLIMVLQFVGFVGGWQQPGVLSSLAGAAVGAGITTWVTFLPCFLFVFLGAPHIEQLGAQPRLSAALTCVTAAVVGVVLNLGVQFSLLALWPAGGGFDVVVAALALLAFVAMERWKAGIMTVISAGAVLGLLRYWVLGA